MKLETLSLSGVLRFPGTVHVNFNELPEGLIAIVGDNGEGKTSLLEGFTAAVYRKLPSRGDRRLVDVARPDATERTCFASTFSQGGEHFATTVALNVKSRSSDAVVSRMDPGTNEGWRPLTDGKVSTFDDYIAEHLPPYHVVLASAFASQDRTGSFVRATPKERKALFSSLLGLDHLAAMAATAARAAKLIEDELRVLDTARLSIMELVPKGILADLGYKRDLVASQIEELRGEASDNDALLSTLAEEKEKHAADAETHEAACARLADFATSLLELGKDAKANDDAIAALQKDKNELPGKVEAKLQTDLCAIEARVRNNQGLLDSRRLIEVACREVESLKVERRSLDASTEAELNALKLGRGVLQECERVAAYLGKKEDRLARALIDVGAIDDVPCGGEGKYASCSFLTRAYSAKEDIQHLRGTDELQESNARVKAKTQNDVESHEACLRKLDEQRDALDVKLESMQAVAADKSNLEMAEARIAELRTDQERVRQESAKTYEERVEAINARLAERNHDGEALMARLAETEHTSAQIQERVEATADAHKRLEDLTRQQELATSAKADLAETLRTQQEAHTRLDEQFRAADDNMATVSRLAHRAATLADERAEWDLLAKALGRNGLPTLEMDAAGPAVASYANQLLEASVGPRFSLELITQQEKKSVAGQKEVFTIRVIDNADGGGARDITDLSGGEQILVDEALKNAFLVFCNQRSGQPMRTCWRDETTGSLDPENAARYVDMLRRLMALAGFDQVLFVTHNAEASALADARIRLKNGKISTEFPPFESVA